MATKIVNFSRIMTKFIDTRVEANNILIDFVKEFIKVCNNIFLHQLLNIVFFINLVD